MPILQPISWVKALELEQWQMRLKSTTNRGQLCFCPPVQVFSVQVFISLERSPDELRIISYNAACDGQQSPCASAFLEAFQNGDGISGQPEYPLWKPGA